jgi:hypothetical protein
MAEENLAGNPPQERALDDYAREIGKKLDQANMQVEDVGWLLRTLLETAFDNDRKALQEWYVDNVEVDEKAHRKWSTAEKYLQTVLKYGDAAAEEFKRKRKNNAEAQARHRNKKDAALRNAEIVNLDEHRRAATSQDPQEQQSVVEDRQEQQPVVEDPQEQPVVQDPLSQPSGPQSEQWGAAAAVGLLYDVFGSKWETGISEVDDVIEAFAAVLPIHKTFCMQKLVCLLDDDQRKRFGSYYIDHIYPGKKD